MASAAIAYPHVDFDSTGTAVVSGTDMLIEQLVLGHLAYGWSAEELHFQHPYLTLGQVHAALSYYWDHQADMDQRIQETLAEVDELARATGSPPFVRRLRAQQSP